MVSVGGRIESLMVGDGTMCMNCRVSDLSILRIFVMYLRVMYYREL